MWQAIIFVGRFGRQIHMLPRKWKWVAQFEADWYRLCEMRETSVLWRKLAPTDKYQVGCFLKHDDGYLQEL